MTDHSAEICTDKLEALRVVLKAAEEVPPPGPAQGDGDAAQGNERERSGRLKRLLALVDGLELMHDANDEAFALPVVGGVQQVMPVRSGTFRKYLAGIYWAEYRDGLPSDLIAAAINTIEARALFEGEKVEVHRRVARLDGRIFIDLGDDSWRAVEIDAGGWRIVEQPPVRFRRDRLTRPLPEPVRRQSGALDRLLDLFRLDPKQRVLVKSWLLAALGGVSPFAILAVVGEAGSGKTLFCKTMARLVDPRKPELRSPPRELRDVEAAAWNAYLIAFDNISSVGPDLADCLCCLATGAGLGGRQLYTNTEEIVFDASRPVLLNGIPDLPARADLLDRALVVHLTRVPDDARRPAAELEAGIKWLLPAALGELCSMLAHGLARRDKVHPPRLPRMADVALWAEACGLEGAAEAIGENARTAMRDLAEEDAFAAALVRFVEARATWTGTAASLLEALNAERGDGRAPDGWPRTPRGAAEKLRRLAPALRQAGVAVSFRRQAHTGARLVELRWGGSGDTVTTVTNVTRAPDAYGRNRFPGDGHGDGCGSNRHPHAADRHLPRPSERDTRREGDGCPSYPQDRHPDRHPADPLNAKTSRGLGDGGDDGDDPPASLCPSCGGGRWWRPTPGVPWRCWCCEPPPSEVDPGFEVLAVGEDAP